MSPAYFAPSAWAFRRATALSIVSNPEFSASVPERLKVPDRGYAWYLFSQAVREIHVESDQIVVKYELLDDYRPPFRRFYL